MFDTLRAVFEARGPESKAVVWAHNSHIGDASATAMGRAGEINIGQLCRREYGDAAVLIGFGTDRGTVTAASQWGGAPETKNVRPAAPDSGGALMREVSHDRFFLDLRRPDEALAEALGGERAERFIGVLYLPETERVSHYAQAALQRQFDGYVWIEVTRFVEPLEGAKLRELAKSHPFST
jgi:erythromycin esterase-like protein